MADLSIIELVVYGIICYAGIIMLVVSAFKSDTPTNTKSQAAIRPIWLVPSMMCAFMLASVGSGVISIDQTTETVTSDYEALNSADAVVTLNSTTTTTTLSETSLIKPVWVIFHLLLFIILLIYVLFNVLSALFYRD